MAIANPSLWRPGTSQWLIAEALVKHGMNRKAAFAAEIRPMVIAQTEPLVFRGKRADGTYGILPVEPDQCTRAYYRTGDVLKAIREHGWDREAGVQAAADEAATEASAPAPEPAPEPQIDTELKLFVAEVRRIRDWLTANDPEGEIDHISYRPIKDGRKMIEAGIPARACLHAMTLHWDRADRQRAGIKDYDPATEFPGGLHAYLDKLVEAGVLICLTGPAGMGKSYWTAKLAERLDVEYGSVPMNEGAGPSWFLGKDTVSGYKESKFQRLWRGASTGNRKGGVIGLEEADASDPNLMLLINDALANDVLDNPVCGDAFKRCAQTVIVFLMNTFGTGADDQYGARNELDFSTLDRIRMGRAFVGYSREVEDLIAFG